MNEIQQEHKLGEKVDYRKKGDNEERKQTRKMRRRRIESERKRKINKRKMNKMEEK